MTILRRCRLSICVKMKNWQTNLYIHKLQIFIMLTCRIWKPFFLPIIAYDTTSHPKGGTEFFVSFRNVNIHWWQSSHITYVMDWNQSSMILILLFSKSTNKGLWSHIYAQLDWDIKYKYFKQVIVFNFSFFQMTKRLVNIPFHLIMCHFSQSCVSILPTLSHSTHDQRFS